MTNTEAQQVGKKLRKEFYRRYSWHPNFKYAKMYLMRNVRLDLTAKQWEDKIFFAKRYLTYRTSAYDELSVQEIMKFLDMFDPHVIRVILQFWQRSTIAKSMEDAALDTVRTL